MLRAMLQFFNDISLDGFYFIRYIIPDLFNIILGEMSLSTLLTDQR